MMHLIPGLPDDLARECLIRVPFESFQSAKWVCKAWNQEIQNPHFLTRRIQSGQTRPIFIIADLSRRDPFSNPNQYTLSLVLLDPESGSCSFLPKSPDSYFPNEFISFAISGVVAVGLHVIVILYVTQQLQSVSTKKKKKKKQQQSVRHINVVYVFDLLTGQWRRGADLPRPKRNIYGLAADHVRRQVMVAGGYDMESNGRMRSAFIYDVARDEWLKLPDMAKDRIQCHAVFYRGRFHAINGLSQLSKPIVRMKCAESLDPDTLQWITINDEFIEALSSAQYLVMWNGEGDFYQVGDHVAVLRGTGKQWEELAKVPNELEYIRCAMTWRDKMVVIEGQCYDGPPYVFVLDLKSCKWTKQDLMIENINEGCAMDL